MSPRRRAFTLIELLVVIVTLAIVILLMLPVLHQDREANRRARYASRSYNLTQFRLALFPYGPSGVYDGFFLGTFIFQSQGLASYDWTRQDQPRFGGDLSMSTWDGLSIGTLSLNASVSAARPNPATQFSLGLPGTFFQGTSRDATGHAVHRGITFDFAGGAALIDSEFLLTPVRGRPEWVATLALRNFPASAETPTILGLWSGDATSEQDGILWSLSLLVDDQDPTPETGFEGELTLEIPQSLSPLRFAVRGTINDLGWLVLIGQEVDQGTARVFAQADLTRLPTGEPTAIAGHYRLSFIDGSRDHGTLILHAPPIVTPPIIE